MGMNNKVLLWCKALVLTSEPGSDYAGKGFFLGEI